MSSLSKGEKELLSSGFGALSLAPTTAPAGAPANGEPAPAAPAAAANVREIDARGLASPLPLLRAHRALRNLAEGQQLRVLTDSPQTIPEFQSMVKHLVEYDLVSQDQVGEQVVHVLRRRR